MSGGTPSDSELDAFEALAGPGEDALAALVDVLTGPREDDLRPKHVRPQLACLALLRHGPPGVAALVPALAKARGATCPRAIIRTIWSAAHGEIPFDADGEASASAILMAPPHADTISAANAALHDLIAETRTKDRAFWQLLYFVTVDGLFARARRDRDFLREVRLLFTEASIKLSPSLLADFGDLIIQDLPEERYQEFLTANPVFLDPLAAEMVPKQRMGVEHTTDYAMRRLDDRWCLVEIEKPQDVVFTTRNDFAAAFTHGFGQVLDFQRWVEDNGSYAQSLMPGIASPRGMLVIGRRAKFSRSNTAKLRRFVDNSRTIDVLTFDDVLHNAETLYRNLSHLAAEA